MEKEPLSMSRQNRPRKGLSPRRSSYQDPYTYFVIASEGTETEPLPQNSEKVGIMTDCVRKFTFW
jgi:hypothetical protein